MKRARFNRHEKYGEHGHIWNSESLEVTPTEIGPFTFAINKYNGVLILEGYEETGSHCTSLLFFGPESKENAHRWHSWLEEDDDGVDSDGDRSCEVNTSTTEFIKKCFDLMP